MTDLSPAELTLVGQLRQDRLVPPETLTRALSLRRQRPHLAGALLEAGALAADQIEAAMSRIGLALLTCPECSAEWLGQPEEDCADCRRAGVIRPLDNQLGKYQLLREIGCGGMGSVYEALDTSLDRRVALKLFRQVGDPDQLERFQQEGQLAARLSHPNIIPVHEVSQKGGKHYLVMELIDGATLDKANLSKPQKVAVMIQLADALGHAHSHGVVHRDLKPANILLTADHQPIVTDFGLARDIRRQTSLTATSAMLGTTQYMAPEQVSGRSRECTPASDVWSLGVIFYQLLADRQPFEGQTAQAIFEAILDVDPAPPCPDDLGWICLHALSKDPSARYPSGVELADDLRRWQAGTSISARPHSTLRRWRKTFVRRRGLIVAATLLGAILTLVGLISRQRSKRPADPIPGPIAEPAKMDTAAEEHQARLHKLMQPVARRIEEVRAQFYIREIDIRQELLSLEKSLVALEKQAGEEPRVWRMLGIGWYLIGWVERAEQALAKAPKDPTARYYLGRIAIDRARISLAGGPRYWTDLSRARLRQALTLLTSRTVDSTPIERLVSQAYVALAREQAKEVARICRDGLERFGTQLGTEEFWLLLTWIGTVEERLNACRAGLARCPHHPWLTLMLGIIHQTQRDYSSAMKAFDRVLQIAPRMSFAHTNRGQVHWLTGNLPAADKDFSTALALDSRDAITLTNRGTVRYEMKRNDAALADLDAALALDPGIAIAMCNRSEIRLRRGQLKGALRDADQAIRLAPRLGQAYNNRANIRKRMGNLRGAIEDYGKALEIDPSSAIRWVNRAETRAQTGDLQGALHDYGQALQRNPADGPAYYNRANLKYQLGDHTGALADYALAIKHEPGYPDAWNNRATLRRQLKDLKGALADYDQAIRLRPDDAGYYRNRGMARGESKDFRGALDDFDKALSLTPDDLALRYNRGRTYSLMGQPTAAAREYRAVLASRPKFAPCWLYLGRALLRSGQRKEALTVLNKGRAVASPELHPAFDALIVPLRKKSVTAPR